MFRAKRKELSYRRQSKKSRFARFRKFRIEPLEERLLLSISGTKWNDLDGNGLLDAGEPTLADWTIYLDANGNNAFDVGEPSTTTDSSGNYSFTGLAPGTYRVGEILETGWEQTFPLTTGGVPTTVAVFDNPSYVDTGGGTSDESDTVQAALSSLGYTVTTFTGTTAAAFQAAIDSADVLLFPELENGFTPFVADASLLLRTYVESGGGLVLMGSSNADSFLNNVFGFATSTNTNASSGTSVQAAGAAGTEFADDPATVSNNNATFWLSGAPAGITPIYANGSLTGVALIPVMDGQIAYLGWDWFGGAPLGSIDNGWSQLLNSAVREVGTGALIPGLHTVEVADGVPVANVNFGNRVLPGEIHGRKWNDRNGDGVFDEGEPVLAGWTMYLDTNGNRILDDGEPATTTNAAGEYSFTGLEVGMYSVEEVVQTGWRQTFPTMGGGPATSVAVFDNPSYVDTGGGTSDESDTIQSALTELGYTVTTFSGFSASDFEAAIASADVLLIPELENGVLPLDAAASLVLRNYVQGGGGLVVQGSVNADSFLNTVFGFTTNTNINVSSGTSTRTSAALGTEFEDDAANLPNNNGTFWLGGAPAGTVSIYTSGANTSVALIPIGGGQVAYLGWDWFNGAPLGALDGGWRQVLGSAILEIGSESLVPIGHTVDIGPGEIVDNVDFGNQSLRGEIHGTKWNDVDGNGVRDDGEATLPGWTIYLDLNNNGEFDESEPSTLTDAEGNYQFLDLEPGEYFVGEVLQTDWEQTFPQTIGDLDALLADLDAAAPSIAALVPNRFDFFEGETGNQIIDGGFDMYDGGNILNTNLANFIAYTNRVVTPSDAIFGPGSEYFTAKYPGLFAMAAHNISINSFSITGNNGADGGGTANGTSLTTTVGGQQYTLFIKRVFNAFDPSINQIIIVPGDGAGISHTFSLNTDNSQQTVSGLGGVAEIYYLLVARQNGGFISDAELQTIANAFLEIAPTGGGTAAVAVGPGSFIEGIDFGNRLIPGEVQGTKWNDLDDDGVLDLGEPPLAGWTIYSDVNGNGVFDEGEPSTVTDFNGNYRLRGLAPGSHRIGEVLIDGWRQSFPGGARTVAVFDNPAFVRTGGSAADESDTVQATLANLGYSVVTFTGFNAAALQNAIDSSDVLLFPDMEFGVPPFAPDATALLRSYVEAGGALVVMGGFQADTLLNSVFEYGTSTDFALFSAPSSRTIDAAGTEFEDDPPTVVNNGATFLLTNQPAGTRALYTFAGSFIAAALIPRGEGQITYLAWDWFDAAPLGFQDGGWSALLDSTIAEAGKGGTGFHVVEISPDETVSDIDFGNVPLPGELRGTKWNDMDGDGFFDLDEPPLAGWTIYVDQNQNGSFDEGEPSAVTAADGTYAITDVPVGFAVVREEVRQGWVQTFPGDYFIEIGPGQLIEDLDFGNRAGVVLTFESSLGSFNVPTGTTFQVTVHAAAAPEALSAFQLNFDNSTLGPDALTLSNWSAAGPGLWGLGFDDHLDSTAGDTFVSAASSALNAAPVALGTFDVTVPAVAPGAVFFFTAGSGSFPFETQVIGSSGVLPIVDHGFAEIHIVEATPPQVSEVVINAVPSDPPDVEGKDPQPTSWLEQRSNIRSISVHFNEEMATISPSQIRLTNLGVHADIDPDLVIPLNASQMQQFGNTLTLVFAPGVLRDGVYSLELMPTITDINGNALDGNGDGVGGDAHLLQGSSNNRLFQLRADFNGDAGVSIFDMPTFHYWFGEFTAPRYADMSGDGFVSILDFPDFHEQFGRSIDFPTVSPGAGALALEDSGAAAASLVALEASDETEVRRISMVEARRSALLPVRSRGLADRSSLPPHIDGESLRLLAEENRRQSAVRDNDTASRDTVFETDLWTEESELSDDSSAVLELAAAGLGDVL